MIWGALTCQELVCLDDWQHICKWERLTSLLTVKAHTPSHLTPCVMNWHHGTVIRSFFYCKCMSSQFLQSVLDRTSVCWSLEPIFTTNALRMTSPWASASPEPNIHDRDMTPSAPSPYRSFLPLLTLWVHPPQKRSKIAVERNGVELIPGLLAFTSQELSLPKTSHHERVTVAAG